MTAPPSSVGAVQVTTASLSPGSAAIEAGAPGAVALGGDHSTVTVASPSELSESGSTARTVTVSVPISVPV